MPPHKSFRFGGPPSFLFPPPISPPPPINVLKRIVNQADEKSIWVQLLTVEDVYETKHGEGAFEHVVAVYWDRAEALKAPTVPQIHKRYSTPDFMYYPGGGKIMVAMTTAGDGVGWGHMRRREVFF